MQANSWARGQPSQSGPDVIALLEGWATSGHGTLPRRLAHSLRHLIDAGVLTAGWRLPPERTLASQLAVSRTTVTQALDELRHDGWLTSTQGSGTRVAGPPVAFPHFGTRVAEHMSSGPGIDLAKGDAPDLSHLPPVSIEMWQLNATCGGAAVNPAGLPALRLAIADLYSQGGTTGHPHPTEPDQIHVTAGSHQASRLLVSALAPRGQAIALAEHSYPGIFDIFDTCGVRAVPVKVDRAGMVPEALEQVLHLDRPVALYFQAGPQIPTGQVTIEARVRALAAIVDRHHLAVFEDTTLAALAFAGTAPTLTDHCRTATVVTTGSLSKMCWSGLRLGWIRGPTPIIEQTIYQHLSFDLGPSIPSQLVALELLPHLNDIAIERSRRLETVVDAALAQLAEMIPDAAITRPDGGSILWARFPIDDSAELVRVAQRHSVRIAPGSIHTAGKTPGPFVRIDVDRPAGHVREGLDRLARAWYEVRSAARATESR